MEIEFKILLPDQGSFVNALVALERRGASRPTTNRQVNHFFDTPDRALRVGGLTLRLREEAGSFRLTAKGRGEGSPGEVLRSRPEVEVEVSGQAALAILGGGLSPLDALQRELARGKPVMSDPVERMRAAVGARELSHLGSFENERTRPGPILVMHGSERITLQAELDETRFPDGRIDRELELEIDDPAQAATVERWLRELVREIGVEWRTAPSKAKRFFEILGS